jgi:hypothetical protein
MPPKKSNLETSEGNKMINFYENKKVQDLLTKYHNPYFDKHRISVPFRLGIVSASGGGKTVFVLNLINQMQDTFGKIYVVYKASEPLYEFLAKSVGDKNITFFTHLSKFPPITDLEKDKQILCIFDDCVTYPEKTQEIIKEIAIRGRKYGRGISMCYLTQSFYKVPRLIRLQFNYLVLLKLGSRRDMEMILNECSLGIEKEQLLKFYKDATKEKFNSLIINLDTGNENEKFSHNFNNFYAVGSESESDEDK